MTHLSPLIIQEQTCFYLENIRVEVNLYLGHFSDIYYFQVKLIEPQDDLLVQTDINNPTNIGLLRIGKADGSLSRELELRQQLLNHKMIVPLLKVCFIEQILIETNNLKQDEILEQSSNDILESQSLQGENKINEFEDYLEEEYYEEEVIGNKLFERGLILLSLLSEANLSLKSWLEKEKSIEESLPTLIQLCQLVNHLHRKGWCLTQINPNNIFLAAPIEFHDFIGAFKIGEELQYGMMGSYCPPELALGYPADVQMSSYVIGVILYQVIHNQLPQVNENSSVDIQAIPGIYQILKACLTPHENRPSISQILNLLLEIQKSFNYPKINWQVAGKSTIGLSQNRWQNEDNYGFFQQFLFNSSESLILGVIADGMGGMEQGEIASQIAVQTILETTISSHIKSIPEWNNWLISLVQEANYRIFKTVRNGGTTLSVVLAIEKKIMIAHLGDSRIFLLRNGKICQLSEDHSLVSNLLATSQITYLESKNHPERNILTKSLGSSLRLEPNEIQNLSLFGAELSITLEDQDVLLLCSDGVWDLVSSDDLCEIFTISHCLSSAVDETINLVLARGANDNATILALSCSIYKSY